jgi:cytoskeleton protein RodZ
LLPAGTVRSYASDKPLDVRLGNCNEASVEIDGKTLDLAPYRHANVAHFKLASGEATLSHSGG